MTTFTCWLGIGSTLKGSVLPPTVSKEHLEDFIKTKAKSIGDFHSLNLTFNTKHNCYQCFVNFLSEKCAQKAVCIFNEIDLSYLEIKAEYRPSIKKTENPLFELETKSKEKNKNDPNRFNSTVNDVTRKESKQTAHSNVKASSKSRQSSEEIDPYEDVYEEANTQKKY
jgi:hypothetical protein